jgi:hypothetical protein
MYTKSGPDLVVTGRRPIAAHGEYWKEGGAMIRRASAILILVAAVMPLTPMPSASAHGLCTPKYYISSVVDPSGGYVFWASAWLDCGENHYSYQGRVKLQWYDNGTWRTYLDGYVLNQCCNLKMTVFNPFVSRNGGCGDSPHSRRFRAFVVYIEAITSSGNVTHRYTSLASVSKQLC